MSDPQYTTSALLKARLDMTETAHDTLIDEALSWATAEIDSYTHRHFLPTTETRYFRRESVDYDDVIMPSTRVVGARTLYVEEDLLSVTTLTNGDLSVIPPEGYWLSPRNESPYYAIELTSVYAWTWDTDTFVTVLGTWGYAATPPPVVVGTCLRLAEWYYKSNKMAESVNPFSGSVTSKPGPGYPPDILTTLDRLVKLAR